MKRASWRLWACLVALALVATACTVPTNSEAIPFSPVPQANFGCTGSETLTIYLTSVGKKLTLVPVQRSNAAKNSSDAAICALFELNQGPSVSEEEANVITTFAYIPESLSFAEVNGSTVSIGLTSTFIGIASHEDAVLAYGQIVYTMTCLPQLGITRVQFLDNGQPWGDVFLPDGSTSPNGVVTRADYRAIGPANCAGASGSTKAK